MHDLAKPRQDAFDLKFIICAAIVSNGTSKGRTLWTPYERESTAWLSMPVSSLSSCALQ